jgi:hypothetical protein
VFDGVESGAWCLCVRREMYTFLPSVYSNNVDYLKRLGRLRASWCLDNKSNTRALPSGSDASSGTVALPTTPQQVNSLPPPCSVGVPPVPIFARLNLLSDVQEPFQLLSKRTA